MKTKLLLISSLFFLFSCIETDDIDGPITPDPDPDPPVENEAILSVNGKIEFLGILPMQDGPHDLLISGNEMYAKRDYSIFHFSIADKENPILKKSFVENTHHNFGHLYEKDNKIYVPNLDDGDVYVFDKDLNLTTKYSIDLENFGTKVIFIDSDSTFWIGGGNGSQGILAECTLTGNILTVQNYWIAPTSGSVVESLIEKDNHLIASIANGEVLSFSKNDIEAGPVSTATYENEPGHEKWGKTLIGLSNQAFWANWGAGFASLNISNPSNISISGIISHSGFKSQFPGAEGTDVYDLTLNSSKNVIAVANGWSGVFLVSPGQPDKVLDYIDLKDIMNYSIATSGNYLYTGNISGGIYGDLKGIVVYKLK